MTYGRFMVVFFIVVIGLIVWGMYHLGQRVEVRRDVCTEYGMSSFTVNRSATVLCVDDKGRVFNLQNKSLTTT